MSATLPLGLITIGHTQSSRNRGSHYADVLFERSNVLHSFWKVHAVRHRVSKDALDFRCQNLFWRTWGDPRLSKTITTATLTTLWSLCQQPIDSGSLQEEMRASSPRSGGSRSKNNPELGRAPTVSKNRGNTPPTASLPMTGASSSQRSKNVRRQSARRTSIDESGGPSMTMDSGRKSPKTSRPGFGRVSSSNRASLAASSNKSKGRPSMNRRKSSQSTAPGKAGGRAVRPALKSPTIASRDIETSALPPNKSVRPFEMPSAESWEDEPTLQRNRLSSAMSLATTPTELVEPDFRNRFAERVASSSNLASMDRMRKSGSVVRFADEIPTNSKIVKNVGSKPDYSNERESSFPYRDSASSVASVAIVDEDDMPVPGLERTKSQLSMMIEETRAQQRRDRLEPEQSSEYPGLSSRRKKEPTDDEKVLAMAHAEGVTKAGGRRIRKGFKFSDGNEARYSSPSPEPIF